MSRCNWAGGNEIDVEPFLHNGEGASGLQDVLCAFGKGHRWLSKQHLEPGMVRADFCFGVASTVPFGTILAIMIPQFKSFRRWFVFMTLITSGGRPFKRYSPAGNSLMLHSVFRSVFSF